MVSFLITALPLIYMTIFGAVPGVLAAHLMLFTAARGILSLLIADEALSIISALAVTLVSALIPPLRRSLVRLLPLLCTIAALSALPYSPLFAVAALIFIVLLLLRRRCISLFTAAISALLLSLELARIYYLSMPAYILSSALLLSAALLLNRKADGRVE